jgi:hypothetical protein
MGYRSEVILAVGPEVMPQFMITMAKSPEARELCWADHDEMIKDYCGEKGAFLFRWAGIKWYDSYEGIQALQDFVEWCENETIEVEGKEVSADEYYRFVRIGEETDDNEVQGWGFDIHIERTARNVLVPARSRDFFAPFFLDPKIFLSKQGKHNENDNSNRLG